MNAPMIRLCTALLASALALAANAEYRCDAPENSMDRRACEAAAQGPEALRRYVNLWTSQMSNLRFDEYVDSSTERSWETKRKATRDDETIDVAAYEEFK